MSATRDKSQKFTFVYSNLYQIYKKSPETAAQPVVPPAHATEAPAAPVITQHVLKSGDLKGEGPLAKIRISAYQAPELIGKRLPKPEAIKPAAAAAPVETYQSSAIQSLKDNLKNLNDLHSRLRFMLQELEELVKE